MSVRDKPIYLSTDVYRALWLLAKSETGTVVSCGEPRTTGISPDAIADNWIRDRMTSDYPEILEHLKREDKATKELIATLQKK